DRRLHGIEPSGQTETNIVIFVQALAMDANAAQPLGKFGVVGENGATIAKTSERLGRKKAGRSGKPKRTEAPSLVARPERLRSVVENEHALGPGDRANRVVIGTLSEQIDRNHGPWLETKPC